MRLGYKILLTIPSVLEFGFFLTHIFPVESAHIVPWSMYYIYVGIINTLKLIQIIILVRLLWRFNDLEKSKKWEWTWIMILFTAIGAPLFIWKKMDEFGKGE